MCYVFSCKSWIYVSCWLPTCAAVSPIKMNILPWFLDSPVFSGAPVLAVPVTPMWLWMRPVQMIEKWMRDCWLESNWCYHDIILWVVHWSVVVVSRFMNGPSCFSEAQGSVIEVSERESTWIGGKYRLPCLLPSALACCIISAANDATALVT